MKILLLGVAGFTGYRFYELFKAKHFIIGTHNQEQGFNEKNLFQLLDVLNFDATKALIEQTKPDVIINTVSFSNVDECEKNKNLAKLLNIDFVIQLTNYLNDTHQTHIKWVNFSTNAVYRGDKPLYNEASAPDPLNYYGYSKMIADEYLSSHYENYLTVRPITMVGPIQTFNRPNPLTFILSKLNTNTEAKLVDDVLVNFLFIDDLVNAIEALISGGFRGSYNISGDEILSWYGLGRQLCDIRGGGHHLLSSCSIDDFPSMAVRPKNTSFDNSLIKETIKFEPTKLSEGIAIA